eukprot:CAMPEP_0116895618 /NCGR_PEP_ID=MMETSP0467-20121206/5102_1 /TAXON_ID=283647 /ORGANISM="Mesodinium pulex, Strain SPMC105" /LENGTH=98 /DNA_ID=CAMNT_0004566449 /DNA_START=1223 /DNA_END=1516 /DNA_ORIENTATION=-
MTDEERDIFDIELNKLNKQDLEKGVFLPEKSGDVEISTIKNNVQKKSYMNIHVDLRNDLLMVSKSGRLSAFRIGDVVFEFKTILKQLLSKDDNNNINN